MTGRSMGSDPILPDDPDKATKAASLKRRRELEKELKDVKKKTQRTDALVDLFVEEKARREK